MNDKLNKADIKKFCTISIDKALHETLKNEAKKDRRTLSVFTTILLEEALTARE